MNSIVFDRRALRLIVPDGNGAGCLGLQHDHSNGIPDELRDTAPRPGSGLAQGVECLLAAIMGSLDWQAREDGLHQPAGATRSSPSGHPAQDREDDDDGSVHKRLKTNNAPLAQLDRATAF